MLEANAIHLVVTEAWKPREKQ